MTFLGPVSYKLFAWDALTHMSPHERFRITSFISNTKWAASIVSPGYGTQPYPYTIDRFAYILELDPLLRHHVLFKYFTIGMGLTLLGRIN